MSCQDLVWSQFSSQPVLALLSECIYYWLLRVPEGSTKNLNQTVFESDFCQNHFPWLLSNNYLVKWFHSIINVIALIWYFKAKLVSNLIQSYRFYKLPAIVFCQTHVSIDNVWFIKIRTTRTIVDGGPVIMAKIFGVFGTKTCSFIKENRTKNGLLCIQWLWHWLN